MKKASYLPLTAAFALVTLAALQSGPAHAQSQPAIKGNMPCLAGLCLGDGPEVLKGLPLNEIPGAERPFSLGESRVHLEREVDLAGLGIDTKKSSVRTLGVIRSGLISVGQFDTKSLDIFERIKLSCKRDVSFKATYKEKDGSFIQVTMALRRLPEDSTEQKWVITHIERRFNDLKQAEVAEMYRSYEERWWPLLKEGQSDKFIPHFKSNVQRPMGFSYGPDPDRSPNGDQWWAMGSPWIAMASSATVEIRFNQHPFTVTKLRETLPACQAPARKFD